MIKAVIIDDETPARNNLKQIITDNFSYVKIIGEADSVVTGVKLLNTLTPDLVLLDINLSDGSGFKLLEKLNDINFKVVFVTAYDSYAIKAFKFNALDYLLKPVKTDLLSEALEKVEKAVNKNYITQEDLKLFLDNYSKNDEDRTIVINEANKISYIPVKEITKLKGEGNYTKFYLNDGRELTVSKTLKIYQELLPEALFYRVNQSYIININFVKEYHKEDGGYIILNDGSNIGLSRRRKDDFLKMMAQRK